MDIYNFYDIVYTSELTLGYSGFVANFLMDTGSAATWTGVTGCSGCSTNWPLYNCTGDSRCTMLSTTEMLYQSSGQIEGTLMTTFINCGLFYPVLVTQYCLYINNSRQLPLYSIEITENLVS